jgi:hypothetical protein
MDYREILDFLAPCGLSCQKCFVYTKGVIPYHSKKLKELLGNFNKYAEGASPYWPELKNFTQFEEVLTLFASPDCKGCRQGDCKHPNCGVIDCYKKKGVDFCFQCDDFPCDKTNFDPRMSKMWLQMNTRMKEIGIEAYYMETMDELRYP